MALTADGACGGPAARVEVRYSDRAGIITGYLYVLILFGAVLALVQWETHVIAFLRNYASFRDERAIMLVGFSGLTAAVFIDLMLQIAGFLSGRPALVLDAEGARGFHGGLWRRIAWRDVYEVETTRRAIRIVRRPRGALSAWSFRHTCPGSHRRWGEYAIHLPLRRTNADCQEILDAVRRHRPDLV